MRHFLLLQGLRSGFFTRLAHQLRQAGQHITKVQFCVGDHLYWQRWARRCQAEEAALPDFYRRLLKQTGASDIVLFGDCRPIHRPAIELAKSLGLGVHVFEEGYFRPDWVTLERDGVNANSKLPQDPQWYLNVARWLASQRSAQAPIESVGPSMTPRVCHDIIYNAGNLLNPIFYPRYRSHVPHSILSEYAAYVKHAVTLPWQRHNDRAPLAELLQNNAPPYFLVALQIPGDSQLTFHSGYADTGHFIAEVLRSFARHANERSLLVFKNHPLDPGLNQHHRIIAQHAQALGCSHRVRFLRSGHLPSLVDHARGLVTVNSTTIGQALFHRCPTIALGKSIFNLPGLTFQSSLDAFWSNADKPDASLFKAFYQVVTHATQINGGLYSARGIEMAVKHAVPRILAQEGKLETLLATDPPTEVVHA